MFRKIKLNDCVCFYVNGNQGFCPKGENGANQTFENKVIHSADSISSYTSSLTSSACFSLLDASRIILQNDFQ